jgi:hypothetical protein
MSVAGAISEGRRAVLEAQVSRLAAAMDDAPVGDLAALSRELRLLAKELGAVPDGSAGVSVEDALAARRAAKQAADG